MINRILVIVVVVPVAIVLIALAVANRTPASFTLDPFNPGNPGLTITQPLFVLLFVALAFGILIGGVATWLKQGRYRKLARQRAQEIESMRQSAARKPQPAPVPGLPSPGA